LTVTLVKKFKKQLLKIHNRYKKINSNTTLKKLKQTLQNLFNLYQQNFAMVIKTEHT
jgi:hypothetical protein